MFKGKLATIIDSLTLSFIIFFVLYFWCINFIHSKNISLILSSLLSTASLLILYLFISKKNNKKNISKTEENYMKNCKNKLIYSPFDENRTFFEKLLSAKYVGNNIFINELYIFYINLSKKLGAYDFLVGNNYKLTSKVNSPLIFICSEVGDDFSTLFENSPSKYSICNFNDIFEIMKEKNIYPIEMNALPNSKVNINLKYLKNISIEFFKKVPFVNTFFSGISLVIISVFIPYSLYYLIFGTLFLIISFISIIVKSKWIKNSKNDNKILKYYSNNTNFQKNTKI